MTARAALALTLLVAAGCRRPATPTTPAVAALPCPDEVLGGRVEELRARVATGGVRFAGVLSRGFLTPRGQATSVVELGAGECVSVVAIGSAAIRDLDAHLYDPSGDLVVEDVEVDAHPTVQLCATAARRVYHALEAFDGQGAYAVLLFKSDRAGLDAVARAMGGHPGAATGAAGGDAALERRVTTFRDGIARRGFQGYGDPRPVDLGGAAAVALPLQVSPDRCYTVAAFADDESSALSLRVLDGDLDEVAGDQAGGRDAAAQFCPGTEGPLSVRVERRAGRGAVVLHAFSADAASVGGEGALWLGVRRGVGDQQSVAAAVTAMGARLVAAQVVAPRPGAVTAPMALLPGEVRAQPLAVPAGACALAIAGGAPQVARVRLEAVEELPARVTAGIQRGTVTAVARCAARPMSASLRVMAERGAGPVALRTLSFAAPAWSRPEALEATAAALTLIGLADAGLRLAETPRALSWSSGGLATLAVERAAGRCARVGVAVGGGEAIALTLRDADGAALAVDEGVGSAAVRRCGPSAERLVVEARRAAPGGAAPEAWWLRWDTDGGASGASR